MANSLLTNPIIIDTDLANFRTAVAAISVSWIMATNGIKPAKIILAVGPGGSSSAGQVTITRPSDNGVLYPPLLVPASQAAYTELYLDDPQDQAPLNWNNFAVTGVTATGTKLFIYYNT